MWSPVMFLDNAVPTLPDGAETEGNHETLEWLRRDLHCNVWSAADAYRFFGYDENERSFWGYCVETAYVERTRQDLHVNAH